MKSPNNSPLALADDIVNGARLKNYGTPLDNHSNTAALWSAWYSRKLRKSINFTAADVCMFNILQKCSREANSHFDDNMVDICGYAQNDWLCREQGEKDQFTLSDEQIEPFRLSAKQEDDAFSDVSFDGVTGEKIAGKFKPSADQEKESDVKNNSGNGCNLKYIDMRVGPLLKYIDGNGIDYRRLKNRVIYVASAYTDGGNVDGTQQKNINISKAENIGQVLAGKGWLPHLPLSATQPIAEHEKMGYEDFMELDHVVLSACGALFRDNSKSVGADREVEYAEKLGIPVFKNLDLVPCV